MVVSKTIGKYQLGRTIGEGTFAKVKLGRNITNNQIVAVKIIDKQMVLSKKLMSQVQREIRTMKLLNHPNIVIGSKTKIYIVMEYVAGGQLSDKLTYAENLSEEETRRYFQQLIDAVDYCHSRGVYHRDLKPENLLLDSQGNLKVSDFGLSALQKPGSLLSTACGSPSYVAPELLNHKTYDGAAADVWACGVILFELRAGYLPFTDANLLNLYTKILRAEYECPKWFTPSHKNLIGRLLNPRPKKRITVAEILEDEWFQKDYQPTAGMDFQGKNNNVVREFFESQKGDKENRIMLGSKYTITETVHKIEEAANNASLSVERMNNSKMQIKLKSKFRSFFNLLAEVVEVAPTDCVVEVSKPAGESELYQEFVYFADIRIRPTSIMRYQMIKTPLAQGKKRVEDGSLDIDSKVIDSFKLPGINYVVVE
uniref:Protein kinase domain-containing protein n=1 Tax=Chenopodium quinoa TaxID=63459 RepID=A0A803N4I1_CHEQI